MTSYFRRFSGRFGIRPFGIRPSANDQPDDNSPANSESELVSVDIMRSTITECEINKIDSLSSEPLVRREWVKLVFGLFWSSFDYAELLKTVKVTGILRIGFAESDISAICCSSLSIGAGHYLIFYSGCGYFVFYQGNNTLGWVNDVSRSVVYKRLPGGCSSDILRLANYLDRRPGLVTKLFCSRSSTFRGFYFGHPRPFHFFADHLSGLYELLGVQRNLLSFQKLYVMSQGCFLPPDELFDLQCNMEPITTSELNENLLADSGFVVRLTRGWHQAYDNFNLRRKIVAYCDVKCLEPRLLRNKYYLKIWVGLCTEKRVWYQQLECLAAILGSSELVGKKVLLIIDGMTAKLGEAVDVAASSKQLSFVGEFLSRHTVCSYELVSIAGRHACTKISYANQVDFFLANAATDSIYPSKFACRPGVVYSSNAMSTIQHPHVRAIRVPSSWVVDSAQGAKNVSEVSFNICPDKVSGLFLSFTKGLEDSISSLTLLSSGRGLRYLGREHGGDVYFVSEIADYISFSFDPLLLDVSSSGLPCSNYADLYVHLETEPTVEARVECITGEVSPRAVPFRDGRNLVFKNISQASKFRLQVRGQGRLCFYGASLLINCGDNYVCSN